MDGMFGLLGDAFDLNGDGKLDVSELTMAHLVFTDISGMEEEKRALGLYTDSDDDFDEDDSDEDWDN